MPGLPEDAEQKEEDADEDAEAAQSRVCVAGLQLEKLYLRDPFYQTLLRQLGF